MKSLLILFISFSSFAQEMTFQKEEVNINPLINGTLYHPLNLKKSTDLVIIISGSGPTDRDGNQTNLKNNSLRYLAENLARNEIAAFGFDKRIFAQMANQTINEKNMLFDDLINDVKDIITFFKLKKQYRRIIIAGHSEGSLIGMIAAQGNADAYISIAGAGRTIDLIIEEQIEKLVPDLKEEVINNMELLKKGITFELKNQMLGSIFRESVQPYMISWLKYNPQDEIKKLKIPILILTGTKDLQVPVIDSEFLKKAKPKSKLVIIENMNHVLKEIKGDSSENMASLSNPDLPIMEALIINVNQFIKSL